MYCDETKCYAKHSRRTVKVKVTGQGETSHFVYKGMTIGQAYVLRGIFIKPQLTDSSS